MSLLLSCLVLTGCSGPPEAPSRSARPQVLPPAAQGLPVPPVPSDEPAPAPRPTAVPPTTVPPTAVPALPAPSPSAPPSAPAAGPPALLRFTGCAPLLARLRGEALRQVGPYGLGTAGDGAAVAGAAAGTTAGGAGAAGAAPASGSGSVSGTNNQEPGVDEADGVKTDGRLLVTVRHRPTGVQVVDVSGPRPVQRGLLPLAGHLHGTQLLLVGRRVVALSAAPGREADGWAPRTAVQVLSLEDPDRPRVERELVAEGSLSGARSLGGRVLLVVQSSPQIRWAHPRDGSRAAASRATAENRRRVLAAGIDSWLPSVPSTRSGGSAGPSCSRTLVTPADSGLSMTSLLSLDPASDAPPEQVTVTGSGSVVYASRTAVYVTTSPWEAQAASGGEDPDGQGVRSAVHRFDVGDLQRPRYTGSGSVPGVLIGQYALSEHAGHLRVASTLGSARAAPGRLPASDNLLTVLRPGADWLEQVGQLRGLGPGERIYGVRFLGDRGYVVTFRETDPLYALDLSDPARPTRTGELHVTGWSSLLHPLADGLLLGLGQEVDGGRTRGSQLSTFDVADDTAPALRSRQVFPQAWSPAEHDPHALLWWPASRLLVVPLWQYDQEQPFAGAVAVRVRPDGALEEAARLEHPRPAPRDGEAPACCPSAITRSVVVGDALLTLSEDGILSSSLDTLQERAWSPYR